MAKVYTLDEAIEIMFEDRAYYLSLDEKERDKMRVYKQRFIKNNLNLNSKMALIRKYKQEAIIEISVKF